MYDEPFPTGVELQLGKEYFRDCIYFWQYNTGNNFLATVV